MVLADRAATFGTRLRVARLRAGLTQEEMARRAGMSLRAVRDIENGRVREPRPESMSQLCLAVGLTAPAVAEVHGGFEVAVLGPVEVRVDGEPVDVGPAKQRALFGLLALQPNQVVTLEEIIDVLWGMQPPNSCVGLVQTYIARLRALLRPDALAAGRGGYRLSLAEHESDLLRFAGLAGKVRQAGVDNADQLSRQALSCWRGELLSNVDFQVRRHPAAVAIRGQRVSVALAFADAVLRLGHHEDAIEELSAVAHAEPLHESLHGRLMLVLAGAGRRAEAAQRYIELRRELSEQLGIEPGAELRAIHLGLLRSDVVEPPAVTGKHPVPAQLPADVSWFTGRDDQLKRLDSLLPGDRPRGPMPLAAVTGMAGIGKTALVVHWAHRVRDQFPDGQLFLDLRGYASRPAVRDTEALEHFLRALGLAADQIPAVAEQAAALYRSLLAGRRVLVLLDNAATAEQVRALLPGGPGCVVVVTSRDRLSGLAVREGALRLPMPELSAQEAQTLLGLTVADDRALAEPAATASLATACAHLPLALRIAAANISDDPYCSITDYVDELRERNRLAALAADGDDQTAVRATFELSHRGLQPAAQRLFRLLSLVPGVDLTVEATAALAAANTAEAATLLRVLASGHLVQQRGRDRYGMHDLLRLYAGELMQDSPGERDPATQRLYDWYLGSAHAAARLLHPGMLRLPASVSVTMTDPDRASDWLDAEYDNLVAAIEHAAEHGPRRSTWLLTDALRPYLWKRASPTTWTAIAEKSLHHARSVSDPRAEAVIHLSFADLHLQLNNYNQAMEHVARLLALTRESDWLDGVATAHTIRTAMLWRVGRLAEAAAEGEEALAVDRLLGMPQGHGATLGNLALIYRDLGRLTEAEELCRRTLDAAGPDRLSLAIRLSNLGEVEYHLGRLDDARRHYTEALAIKHRFTEPETRYRLAAVLRDTGELTQAEDLARQALTMTRESRDRRHEANALNTVASILARHEDYAEAVDLHEQAIALAHEIGERGIKAEGLVGLARTTAAQGDGDRATGYVQQALAIAQECGYRLVEDQALRVRAAIQVTP